MAEFAGVDALVLPAAYAVREAESDVVRTVGDGGGEEGVLAAVGFGGAQIWGVWGGVGGGVGPEVGVVFRWTRRRAFGC